MTGSNHLYKPPAFKTYAGSSWLDGKLSGSAAFGKFGSNKRIGARPPATQKADETSSQSRILNSKERQEWLVLCLCWCSSDTLFVASQTRRVSALLGVLFVSYCFSNVSPAMQSGRPVPPSPTSGWSPWHLSPAESRSRPHVEPGRSCLFSAWQLWEQKIQQRVTSWHVYSRSCPCFF